MILLQKQSWGGGKQPVYIVFMDNLGNGDEAFLFVIMLYRNQELNRIHFYRDEFLEFLLRKVLLPQFLPYSKKRPVLVYAWACRISIVLLVIFFLPACVNLALFSPQSLLILYAGLYSHISYFPNFAILNYMLCACCQANGLVKTWNGLSTNCVYCTFIFVPHCSLIRTQN